MLCDTHSIIYIYRWENKNIIFTQKSPIYHVVLLRYKQKQTKISMT